MTSSTSPVYAWQKHPTLTDYRGHLSALFFISGCNFSCGFCHNARLMGQARPGLSWQRVGEILDSLPQQWVDSVTITGGEPLLHAQLGELIARITEKGLLIKLDTNGSRPDQLSTLLPGLNYVALDIKTCQAHYPHLTGCSAPERILQTAALLRDSGVPHELRTTIIEAHHTDEVMTALLEEIQGARRYVLQPFIPHPDLPDEKFRTMTRTTPQRLQELAVMAGKYVQEVQMV
jgi:pyruvate formate lyase activating enzyme